MRNYFTKKYLIGLLIAVILVSPLNFAAAKSKPKIKNKEIPSVELSEILQGAVKSVSEEAQRECYVASCEGAVLQFALARLADLSNRNLLEAGKKTGISIITVLAGGAVKVGGEAVRKILQKTAEELLKMAKETMKEKDAAGEDENIAIKGKIGGCDHETTLTWNKQTHTVAVKVEGDCHCSEHATTIYGKPMKPLAKFRIEFDLGVDFYLVGSGENALVQRTAALMDRKDANYHPYLKLQFNQAGECGCQDGKPVKEVSSGFIKPNSPLAFLDTAMEKVVMFFTFGPRRKAERALGYAEEKMAEIAWLAESGNLSIMDKVSGRYEYFINTAWREIGKIKKENEKAAATALFSEGLSVDEKTMEEIIRGQTEDGNYETTKQILESLAKFMAGLSKISENAEKARREQLFGKDEEKKENDKTTKEAKKEEIEQEAEKAESDSGAAASPKPVEKPAFQPPTPKPAEEIKTEPSVSPKPAEKPAAQPVPIPSANVCGDQKVAGLEECDPPGEQAQCYEGEICDDKCQCEYRKIEDVCGDGKLGPSELCDGELFSKQCLDSVETYKQIYDNPDFKPHCFNNCRGCEAVSSVAGE